MHRFLFFILSFILFVSCSKEGNFFPSQKNSEKLNPQLVSLPTKNNVDVKIALFLPLSGKYDYIGRSALDAIQLALRELKADNIKLKIVDIGSDTSQTTSVIESFDFSDIDIILGPIFSKQAEIIYPFAYKNNIIMITFSNDKQLLNKPGLYIFDIMTDQQIDSILEYAAKNNYYNLYSILPNNKFGKNSEKEIIDKKGEYKVNIKKILFYNHNNLNLIRKLYLNDAIIKCKHLMKEDVSNKIVGFGKSAMIFPESNENLMKIFNQLQFLHSDKDIHFKVLGIGDWNKYSLTKNTVVNKAWVADIPHNPLYDFNDRFVDVFKYVPLRIAAIAYDSMTLISAISYNTNDVLMINYQNLERENGYNGVTGTFKLNSDGSNKRLFSIYEYDHGASEEIKPADIRF